MSVSLCHFVVASQPVCFSCLKCILSAFVAEVCLTSQQLFECTVCVN